MVRAVSRQQYLALSVASDVLPDDVDRMAL
jgi:hypothetical protein